jgi:hypothetical protein
MDAPAVAFLVLILLAVALLGQMAVLRRREESYLDVLESRIRTMPEPIGFPAEAYHPLTPGRKEAG